MNVMEPNLGLSLKSPSIWTFVLESVLFECQMALLYFFNEKGFFLNIIESM